MIGVAGSKEKIEAVWPMWSDRKRTEEAMEMSKEMYEQIKKAHNL